MLLSRSLFLSALLWTLASVFPSCAPGATVLVLQFHNKSEFVDLNWVGESISETLLNELSANNQIVYGRKSRSEALRRLSLRADTEYTKATLIRLGQSVDADYVCYGNYSAMLPAGASELKTSSIQIDAHFLDLRKFHPGPDLSEAGKLADLSRLEEHLAWEALRYLNPSANLPLDRFLTPAKLTRADAEESYVRGLLSTNKDQQERWFAQSVALDPRFSSPVFELGKLYLERKDYAQASSWLERISASDPHYPEARFKLGISAYGAGNYSAAANDFRELSKTYPLGEVFNNQGAAEDQAGMPAALEDLRRALEGDPEDPIYLFNLGSALLRNNSFDEAQKYLSAALQHDPDDSEARALLEKAQRKEVTSPHGKPLAKGRLKPDLDLTAFRQLKAMVQPRGSA